MGSNDQKWGVNNDGDCNPKPPFGGVLAHTHTDVYIHTYMYIHMHTCTYICIHVHTYAHPHPHPHTHIYIYTHRYTYTYLYIHMYIDDVVTSIKWVVIATFILWLANRYLVWDDPK